MFHLQTNPSLIKVVKGNYEVKCTQRQLDEVEANSSGSPTKMIRLFMDTFFTEEELGLSSCYGNINNEWLDRDIIAACKSNYWSYTYTRSYSYSVYYLIFLEYVQGTGSIKKLQNLF